MGIAEEVTGKPRDRLYVYKEYTDILDRKTLPSRMAPNVEQRRATVFLLFAAAFSGAAAALPLFAAAFCGFVRRFQRGAPVEPFFVACSPACGSADPRFGEAIPGFASAFQR